MKKFIIFAISLIVLSALLSIAVFASDAVASVGGNEYASLQEAIDAAQSGDTVTLLKDLTIETDLSNAAKGYFHIYADDNIIIDLGGKTIDVTENSTGNFILFYNYGELVIKNGTVNLTSTIDRAWNAQSTIVLNRGGVLTMESGTYTHNGGTSMAFVLDNSGNSFGDATMIINGGTYSTPYRAIRMRMADTTLNGNPGNGEAFLIINGGYIHGANSAVWGHITNAYSGALGTLNITGGTLEGGLTAINMMTDGYENISVTISGDAHINGEIAGEGADFNITGGTYSKEVSAEFFADGFVLVDNGDGTYSVGVTLENAFVFLGYSVNESELTSITAGYQVDYEIISIYCEKNSIAAFDFGCAFGVGSIIESTAISFSDYTEFQNFNVKVRNIDSSNQEHLDAQLAMALYIDRGLGKEYVVSLNGVISFVDSNTVPTVTFGSFINQ